MGIDLNKLPRTVTLVQADGTDQCIPGGFPVLVLLDQTKLPHEEEYLRITDWREAIDAIKTLKVRGAPAIGIAGAAAVALRAAEYVYASNDEERSHAIDFDRVFVLDEAGFDPGLYRTGMDYASEMIKRSRPTAVNLAWAVDACMQLVDEKLSYGASPADIESALFEFVCEMIEADESANREIGRLGASLLPDGCTILTHCNAGSLATAFYGTALGIVYAAAEGRGVKRVYSDETRPVGQGARLTVWELSKAGVPVTLICDDMAADVMSKGEVDAVVVGADRIAANGDVANKIGTLGVAILAKHFGIPFYVAAPTSTIDLSVPEGGQIPIEERDRSEVLPVSIEGVDVYNPAFDVTSARLVTKIVTEKGIFEPNRIADALS